METLTILNNGRLSDAHLEALKQTISKRKLKGDVGKPPAAESWSSEKEGHYRTVVNHVINQEWDMARVASEQLLNDDEDQSLPSIVYSCAAYTNPPLKNMSLLTTLLAKAIRRDPMDPMAYLVMARALCEVDASGAKTWLELAASTHGPIPYFAQEVYETLQWLDETSTFTLKVHIFDFSAMSKP